MTFKMKLGCHVSWWVKLHPWCMLKSIFSKLNSYHAHNITLRQRVACLTLLELFSFFLQVIVIGKSLTSIGKMSNFISTGWDTWSQRKASWIPSRSVSTSEKGAFRFKKNRKVIYLCITSINTILSWCSSKFERPSYKELNFLCQTQTNQ